MKYYSFVSESIEMLYYLHTLYLSVLADYLSFPVAY